ncbi:uncharacterized protein LOC116615421 isoform X2 [Nematostella vectensis]|nr:uncharacterized protein LOC116615421 isoform X2 [Nematostella vectensis]XP_032232927.1 uncharacterized protein LOC116615421 isoform X2 [Nematostella vectensis]
MELPAFISNILCNVVIVAVFICFILWVIYDPEGNALMMSDRENDETEENWGRSQGPWRIRRKRRQERREPRRMRQGVSSDENEQERDDGKREAVIARNEKSAKDDGYTWNNERMVTRERDAGKTEANLSNRLLPRDDAIESDGGSENTLVPETLGESQPITNKSQPRRKPEISTHVHSAQVHRDDVTDQAISRDYTVAVTVITLSALGIMGAVVLHRFAHR